MGDMEQPHVSARPRASAPNVDHFEDHSPRDVRGLGVATDERQLERLARKVRMLLPHVAGDVRAELEEIRAELEALSGPSATIVSIGATRKR